MPSEETGLTWETACRCGLRYCRSGWPAAAPRPADLPDPLRYLNEQRIPEEGPGQAQAYPERGLEAGQ